MGWRDAALVIAGLSLLVGSFAPRRLVAVPPLPVPYPRVACDDFDALRDEIRASGNARRVVVVVPKGAWSRCAHLAAPVASGDAITVAEASTILVEIDAAGASRAVETCLGCDIVGPASPARTRALAIRQAAPPLLLLVAFALFASTLARRARRRGTPPVRHAARVAEPELAPTAIGHLELTPLEATTPQRARGPFVWLERGELVDGASPPAGPHLRLASPSPAFRQGASPWPRLVGPGAVSGMAVAPGEEAPLASGDVVRIGQGPPFRLALPGLDAPPLRLRLAERGHRLGAIFIRRPAFVPLVGALVIVSIAALVASSVADQRLHGALAAGALLLFAALRALGWREAGGALVRGDGAFEHHLEGHPPQPLAALHLVDRGPGVAHVMALSSDGREILLEAVRPRGRGPEALALAEQWIAEAKRLAQAGPRAEFRPKQ